MHDVLYITAGIIITHKPSLTCKQLLRCSVWILQAFRKLTCIKWSFSSYLMRQSLSYFPRLISSLKFFPLLFHFINPLFSISSRPFPHFLSSLCSSYLLLSIYAPFKQLLLVSFCSEPIRGASPFRLCFRGFPTKRGEKQGEIKVTTPSPPRCRSKQALSVIVQ